MDTLPLNSLFQKLGIIAQTNPEIIYHLEQLINPMVKQDTTIKDLKETIKQKKNLWIK
jgi:hypothetical protein